MNPNAKLNKVRNIVIVAGLLASFFLGFASPVRADISVFVNEIHYDNAGGDTGEAIEIAAPAGTDLTGWSIALYNGSASQLNVYGTIALSGIIPDQQNGFGTLAFFRAGIQNGAPDGMALVDPGNAVVQFLSYEGSFTAASGPAAGMTSTDIGVAESSSTAVGDSLQLTGTGSDYEDFTWATPSANTFDAVNTGQTFSGGGDIPPSVSSTTPTDGGTGVAVDANIAINFSEGVTVTGDWFDINCTNSGNHSATVSGGPQSYTLDPDSDFDNDETCTVTVFAAQVTDADTDDPPDNMAADYVFSFDTTLGVTDFVINEIHADPDPTDGDANGDGTPHYSDDEFVEIVNNSDSDVDISGWTLADGYRVRHTFPADTVVPAHCAVVIFGGGSPAGPFGNAVVQTASSGSLGLNNSGDTVTLNDGTTDQATADYGSEGGDDQSLTRDPDVTGASFVKHSEAASSGGALFSPGTMIDGSLFPGCIFGACGDPATLIHEVQGNGSASPMVGAAGVIIEGVVVGDFQDTTTELRGFFLQEEDADSDTDPATSEGIFVYDDGFGADVSVGDVVRVMGDVTEYYDFTQLYHVSNVAVCDTGVASAATVNLPVSSLGEWEQYEGMLINIPQTLYATGNYYQGYRGEVDLSVGDRLDNPTNVTTPGAAANALQDLNDRSRIQLDDGSRVSNPGPFPPYIGDGNTLRAGDTIPGLTGVLGYDWGEYEVHPTEAVNFTRVNVRPVSPPDVGGTLKVASFNVLNYFTTIDTGAPICGPAGDQGCRGADSAAEFTRQRDKIIAAILTLDADVVGLMELENHPTDAALQDLVDGLNDVAGPGTYDFIPTGPIGDDAIKVGLIYQVGAVTPIGFAAILDSSVDPTFNDDKNRPALAQTFKQNGTGERFTVVVNHLKSKGSSCDDIGDPDTGDGQGNCNLTRTSAAIALTNWLATDPTGSGDFDFLIIGDLNSYAMEDPIAAIESAGYTNLIETLIGADAYSYVYYGQAGYLDHALSSPNLTGQVAGAAVWHINADEPSALDYNDFNQPALYNPDQYRSSDHDPVLIGLNLEDPTAITLASFTAQAGVGSAALAWETGTEVDNAGFNLYRAAAPDGPYTRINAALIVAEGDPVAGASYSFVDTGLAGGVYYYKLEDVDLNGVTTLHGPVAAIVLPRFRRPALRPAAPGI